MRGSGLPNPKTICFSVMQRHNRAIRQVQAVAEIAEIAHVDCVNLRWLGQQQPQQRLRKPAMSKDRDELFTARAESRNASTRPFDQRVKRFCAVARTERRITALPIGASERLAICPCRFGVVLRTRGR